MNKFPMLPMLPYPPVRLEFLAAVEITSPAFAVESICDDLVRVGVSVVEIQLNAKKAWDR